MKPIKPKILFLLLSALLLLLAGCGDKGPSGRDLVDFLNFEKSEDRIEFTRAEVESFPSGDDTYSIRVLVTVRLLESRYERFTPSPSEMAELLGDSREEEEVASLVDRKFDGHLPSLETYEALRSKGIHHPQRPVILREVLAARSEDQMRGRGHARRAGNRWIFDLDDEDGWEFVGDGLDRGAFRSEFPEDAVIWGGRRERNQVQAAFREYRSELAAFAREFRRELEAAERREAARLEELEAFRQEVLAGFSEGRMLAGTLVDPTQGEVGLALEIIAFNAQSLSGRALVRNDGGWSVSREVDFHLRIPTAAGSSPSFSITLSPGNAVQHGGVLLAQTRGTLTFNRDNEGLWHFLAQQNQRLQLRALDESEAESLRIEWQGREAAVLDQFSEGSLFRGLYRWPGGNYTHEFILTVTSSGAEGEAVQATIESLTDLNLRRPLRGRIVPHQYQAQGRVLRLASSRDMGMSGERDPLFGNRYALEWEFRSDGSGWLVSFRDHDIRLEPADASLGADLQARREAVVAEQEAARAEFAQAMAVGVVYRGIWVSSNDQRGFPVSMIIRRSEQGGRLFQVEFAHGDNPADSMTFTGSVDPGARTIILNRDDQRRGSGLPFISHRSSFNLSFISGGLLEGSSSSAASAGRGQIRLEADLDFSRPDDAASLAQNDFPAHAAIQSPGAPPSSSPSSMHQPIEQPATPASHPSVGSAPDHGGTSPFSEATALPASSGAHLKIDGEWQPIDAVPFSTRLHLPGQLNANIGVVMAYMNIDDNAVSADLDGREVDFFFRGTLLPQDGLDPALNVPHMTRLSPNRRGLQVELRRMAPGLAGILPEHRLSVTLDRIGTDGYRLRSARPLSAGHYLILVGQSAYVLNVP